MAGGASTCNFHLSDLRPRLGDQKYPVGLWHEAPCLESLAELGEQRSRRRTLGGRQLTPLRGLQSPGLSPSKASPSPLWPPPSLGMTTAVYSPGPRHHRVSDRSMGLFCLDPASHEVLASLAAFWDPSCPSTTLCCLDTHLFPLAWKIQASDLSTHHCSFCPTPTSFLIPNPVGHSVLSLSVDTALYWWGLRLTLSSQPKSWYLGSASQ